MGKKHFYHTFGDNVPEDITKQFNKILRHEEYLLEKDPLGKAIFFGNENELYKYNIEQYINDKENEENLNNESVQEIELLKQALKKLKKIYPLEHEIVMHYYFSDKKTTMIQIAKDKNISKQAVSQILKRAYMHLKELVESDKK